MQASPSSAPRATTSARCPSSGCRRWRSGSGLDLSPVDPFSDDEALWLLACQWPDNPARFGRLRGALANVRASAHPPRLERGDMVTDLPRVAATIAGTGPLVVFHSWVAAYLDEPQQRALAQEVSALGAHRPVHHLYCETPFETPGLPTPPSPVPRDGPDLATTLVHIGPGDAAARAAGRHPPARLLDPLVAAERVAGFPTVALDLALASIIVRGGLHRFTPRAAALLSGRPHLPPQRRRCRVS